MGKEERAVYLDSEPGKISIIRSSKAPDPKHSWNRKLRIGGSMFREEYLVTLVDHAVMVCKRKINK